MKLNKFINRLHKIGIEIILRPQQLSEKVTCIFIDKINNQEVKETYKSLQGFILCFKDEDETNFTNLKEIFKLIRKYNKNEITNVIK